MNSIYNPRFKSDETVRVLRDQLAEDGSVLIAAGSLCKVNLAPATAQGKYTVRCVMGSPDWHEVAEADLEYHGRTFFSDAPVAGQLVTGRIERISMLDGCPAGALVMLERIQGIYRIQVLNLPDEAVLRMTAPKDKVEFVVTQAGELAYANAFRNLTLKSTRIG